MVPSSTFTSVRRILSLTVSVRSVTALRGPASLGDTGLLGHRGFLAVFRRLDGPLTEQVIPAVAGRSTLALDVDVFLAQADLWFTGCSTI